MHECVRVYGKYTSVHYRFNAYTCLRACVCSRTRTYIHECVYVLTRAIIYKWVCLYAGVPCTCKFWNNRYIYLINGDIQWGMDIHGFRIVQNQLSNP